MSKKFVFIFLAFFLAISFASAQEAETADAIATDLSVKEPTLLPDSPFYFLKEWSRGIGNFLTFSPVKKAERQLQQANERLAEVKKLAEKTGNEQIVAKAMEKYEKAVEKTKEKMEKVKEKNAEQYQKLVEKFDKDNPKQIEVLKRVEQKLQGKLPEKSNATEAIKRVIEKQELRIKDKIQNVESVKDKKVLCADVITPAKNQQTGKCQVFKTSCLPAGWQKDESCGLNTSATLPVSQ